MYLSLLVVLGGVVSTYLIARRVMPGAPFPQAFCAVTASALLFNPYGLSNAWLWGVNLENAIVAAALLLGVVANLYIRRPRVRFGVVVALCLAATYTFANGLMLWLLLWPRWFVGSRRVGDPSRKDTASWTLDLAHVAVFVIVTWSYFQDYIRPPHHPPLSASLADPVHAFKFYLAWLGAPLAPVQHSPVSASETGAVALGIWLLCGVSALLRGGWARAAPWLAVSGYSLAAGAAVAAGRSSLGLESALPSRYVLHVSLFYVGLNGLCWLMASTGKAGVTRRGVTLGAVALLSVQLALVGRQWDNSFEKHVRYFHDSVARGETALRFAQLAPNNPDIALIYPDPIWVIEIHESLVSSGILADERVPGLEALEVDEQPYAKSATLGLSFDGERLRAVGHLDTAPLPRAFTHLLGYSESVREFFAVLPLRPLAPRRESGEREIDLELPLGGLVGREHRVRLYGFDKTQRRLTPLDIELTLQTGAAPSTKGLPINPAALEDASGGMTIEMVQGQVALGRDELVVTSATPVRITGWAIDVVAGGLPSEVFVRVDSKLYAAHQSVQRPDVSSYFANPVIEQCGIYCVLPWDALRGSGGVDVSLVIRGQNGALRTGPRLVLRTRDE